MENITVNRHVKSAEPNDSYDNTYLSLCVTCKISSSGLNATFFPVSLTFNVPVGSQHNHVESRHVFERVNGES